MSNRSICLFATVCLGFVHSAHADPGAPTFQDNLQTVERLIETRKQGLAALESSAQVPAVRETAPAPVGAMPTARAAQRFATGRDPFAQTPPMLGGGSNGYDDDGTYLPRLRLKGITMKSGFAVAMIGIDNDEALVLRAGETFTVRDSAGAPSTIRLHRIHPTSVELETSARKRFLLR